MGFKRALLSSISGHCGSRIKQLCVVRVGCKWAGVTAASIHELVDAAFSKRWSSRARWMSSLAMRFAERGGILESRPHSAVKYLLAGCD